MPGPSSAPVGGRARHSRHISGASRLPPDCSRRSTSAEEVQSLQATCLLFNRERPWDLYLLLTRRRDCVLWTEQAFQLHFWKPGASM